MKNKVYGVIGGDSRQEIIAQMLEKEGKEVNRYLLGEAKDNKSSLLDFMNDSDIIIGGLPFSRDNEYISATNSDEKVKIIDIFKMLNDNQLMLVGKIDQSIIPNEKQHLVYDYFEREELAILNNIPSAEGAIQLAMEKTEMTIHGSNVLVLGYGRLGKILCKMLNGIGANVYAEARKVSDIAWINAMGYNFINIKDLSRHLDKFDIIFNTVPSIMLPNEYLDNLDKSCLIIDLASSKGLDFDYAKNIGLNAIWELGIPGKVAPITAAKCIKDTVFNIIEEIDKG